MRRVEKTVFLSYRRSDGGWALAVHYALKFRGYDVFFDFTGLGSGAFDRVILENVRSRAHFVVVLTPRALDRCADPEDWLRREIEEALRARRNIVPIMVDGFAFDAEARRKLTGRLARLKEYHAHEVALRSFESDIEVLDKRFLSVALDDVMHPLEPPAPPPGLPALPLARFSDLLRSGPEVPATKAAAAATKSAPDPAAGSELLHTWMLARLNPDEKAAAKRDSEGWTPDPLLFGSAARPAALPSGLASGTPSPSPGPASGAPARLDGWLPPPLPGPSRLWKFDIGAPAPDPAPAPAPGRLLPGSTKKRGKT